MAKDTEEISSPDGNVTIRITRRTIPPVVEILIWFTLISLFNFRFFYFLFYNGLYVFSDAEFLEKFIWILFGLILPILFKLIFGRFPIDFLLFTRTRTLISPDGQSIKIGHHEDPKEIREGESYDVQCIKESRVISERVFNRSGVYLLVGCVIAFAGITIFYSPIFQYLTPSPNTAAVGKPISTSAIQAPSDSSTPQSTTATLQTNSNDISNRLIDYLPRFGSLFFMEFIAFFFLKQYRTMMEEYRYYEAIKRKRQDNYNLVELAVKYKESPELMKLLVDKVSQSTITKLASGETTEILETQKIVNQDMDIFAKFTDLIKEIKGK